MNYKTTLFVTNKQVTQETPGSMIWEMDEDGFWRWHKLSEDGSRVIDSGAKHEIIHARGDDLNGRYYVRASHENDVAYHLHLESNLVEVSACSVKVRLIIQRLIDKEVIIGYVKGAKHIRITRNEFGYYRIDEVCCNGMTGGESVSSFGVWQLMDMEDGVAFLKHRKQKILFSEITKNSWEA